MTSRPPIAATRTWLLPGKGKICLSGMVRGAQHARSGPEAALRVPRTPEAPPGDAFTAVHYRGTWYWISDNDRASKRALTFLLLFFSLAETGVVSEAPVLTIPVQ